MTTKQKDSGVVIMYQYDEHNQKMHVGIVEIDGHSYVYSYKNEYDENVNLINAHRVCEEKGIEFTDEFEYHLESS